MEMSGDEKLELNELLVDVQSQEFLEKKVQNEVEDEIQKLDDARDDRLLKRLDKEILALKKKISVQQDKVDNFRNNYNAAALQELERLKSELDEKYLLRDQVVDRHNKVASINDTAVTRQDQEDLVALGKATPFDNQNGNTAAQLDSRPVKTRFDAHNYISFDQSDDVQVGELNDQDFDSKSLQVRNIARVSSNNKQKSGKNKRKRRQSVHSDDDYSDNDGGDYAENDEDGEEEEEEDVEGDGNNLYYDDLQDDKFRERVTQWALNRYNYRNSDARVDDLEWNDVLNECLQESPDEPNAYIGDLSVPGEVYTRLFEYQRTCLKWLYDLYNQSVGGIVGDEMGLGKTIQIIAFLAALHFTPGKWQNSVIIVCPATVLTQWCKMFHEWWPPLRIVILHSSSLSQYGGGNSNLNRSSSIRKILNKVWNEGHVLITTYEGVRQHREHILNRKWGYVILDEGHKIRNPEADITMCCKQFNTPRRLILSGTPIQNNLVELWSLFDFVYPGRLGTLPVFQSQFEIPIKQGGYANASAMQVQVAYKCAIILRDLINPYLLRRMKADVAIQMPKKDEKVLFVKLTDIQRQIYEDFLQSSEVESIFDGKRHALYGIDILRKICNHPDLLFINSKSKSKKAVDSTAEDKVDFSKSGKLAVVKNLLHLWKQNGHKVLLFTQTRQMQVIMEQMVQSEGYSYLKMDGTTPVKDRMSLVDRFNCTRSVYIFLLTTKVGGLGVNLTGADRVVIYDPDWNPSTDIQSRERAWRLGQQKPVTIYRLMTSGTIEEKIYHRQIFKQFLTNKILKDPKQRRFFKSNDLHDLFSLAPADQQHNETRSLFDKSGQDVSVDQQNLQVEDHIGVEGVAREESFRTADSAEEKAGQHKTDDAVLDSIFQMDGLHTILKHDAVMDSTRPDYVIVEREATRMVDSAMSKLKNSYDQSRQSAGRQSSSSSQQADRNANQSSSATILNRLKSRNRNSNNQQGENDGADTDKNTQYILEAMINHLRKKPTQRASSQELATVFQQCVSEQSSSIASAGGNDDELALFRQLVKAIATFHRSSSSSTSPHSAASNRSRTQGYWQLKSEFQ
ncbi:hypothetical protein MP228_000718 [Amoeboaphelidium protococcarum]|nr:hypothetical protein MP228_000718 [Amoeboaphelidium protococcarum]